jgi:hypothetical protein
MDLDCITNIDEIIIGPQGFEEHKETGRKSHFRYDWLMNSSGSLG